MKVVYFPIFLCVPVGVTVNLGFKVCFSVFRVYAIYHYSDLILL